MCFADIRAMRGRKKSVGGCSGNEIFTLNADDLLMK